MESEQIAVLRAVRERLLSLDDMWGDRVYADRVPLSLLNNEQITRPYVVMLVSSDQPTNITNGYYAKLVITVKIVADDKLTALQGSAKVSDLLDRQGIFQYPATSLNGGADWVIKTVARDKSFSMTEDIGNSTYVYHEGSTYIFEVEGLRNNG